MKFEFSAGGIVFKKERNQVKILVSQHSQHHGWVFPKGLIGDHIKGEKKEDTALREVEEEGRVKSKIVSKTGSNDYIIWDKLQKKKIIKKVTFFLMEYLGESNLKYYDVEVVLEREWMSYEEATEKLAFDSEKILLRKAKNRLDSRKI